MNTDDIYILEGKQNKADLYYKIKKIINEKLAEVCLMEQAEGELIEGSSVFFVKVGQNLILSDGSIANYHDKI